MDRTEEVAVAALLHEVGVLLSRAGEAGDSRDLGAGFLEPLAADTWIPLLAVAAARDHGPDRLAAARTDRALLAVHHASRVAGGCADSLGGSPYAALLDGIATVGRAAPDIPEARWLMPTGDAPVGASRVFVAPPTYRDLADGLRRDLMTARSVRAVADAVERHAGRVPAGIEDRPDLSLAGHAIATAAVATALDSSPALLVDEDLAASTAPILALAAIRVDGLPAVAAGGPRAMRLLSRVVARAGTRLPAASVAWHGPNALLAVLPATEAAQALFAGVALRLRGWTLRRLGHGPSVRVAWMPVAPAALSGQTPSPWKEIDRRLAVCGPEISSATFQPRDASPIPRRGAAPPGAVLAFGFGIGALPPGAPKDLARRAALLRSLDRLAATVGHGRVQVPHGFLATGAPLDLVAEAAAAREAVATRTQGNPAFVPSAALVPGGPDAASEALVWLAAERAAGGDHLGLVDPAPPAGRPAALRMEWDRASEAFVGPLTAATDVLPAIPATLAAAIGPLMTVPEPMALHRTLARARRTVPRRARAAWDRVEDMLVAGPGQAIAVRWYLDPGGIQ